MMKRFAYTLAFWLALLAPAAAQFGACLPAFCGPPPSTACVNSGHAAAFLTRASAAGAALDGTHIAAYTSLLNSLDAHALSCKIDVLHVYATQNTIAANLNLLSSNYPATVNGVPTFTADRGYTGVNASTTVFIDTGFNGNTAVASNYTGPAAHISAWQLNSTASSVPIGSLQSAPIFQSYFNNNPGSSFICLNNVNTTCGQNVTLAVTSIGRFLLDRPNGFSGTAYYNGASTGVTFTSGSTIPNFNFYTIAYNQDGTAFGSPAQVAAITIGGHLSATDISNLDTDLRTYGTAVGVP